jgi:hypothetical protein
VLINHNDSNSRCANDRSANYCAELFVYNRDGPTERNLRVYMYSVKELTRHGYRKERLSVVISMIICASTIDRR